MAEPQNSLTTVKYNDGITYEGWKDPIDIEYLKGQQNISVMPGIESGRPDPYEPASICNCDANFEIKAGTTLQEVVDHIKEEQSKPQHFYCLYNLILGKVKFPNFEPFIEMF